MEKAKYYNEDLKLKFATEADVPSSYKRFAKQMFSASFAREDELQKELSEWPREEIIDFLEKKSSFAYGTFKTRLYSVNSYLSWANKNFIPIEISEVDFSEVQKNNLFASPSDFQRCLDLAFEPIVMNSSSILYRSFFWLIYMGVSLNDIWAIESSEVDIKNKALTVGDSKFEIPQEAIPTFKKCKTLKKFIVYASNPHPMERLEGSIFLRPIFKGSFEGFQKTIANYCQTKARQNGVEISHSAVRRSGVFYRMYQLEKEGIAPNYLEAYLDFAEGASDWIRNNRKSVYISSTKIEYEAWKKAFYPETKI